MKGAIIYKGKYGATQQYAEWIGADLGLPVYALDIVTPGMLLQYDFIIAGASVYAGKLQNKNFLKRYCDLMSNKKLFLFIVCATAKTETEKLDAIIKTNIPPALIQKFDIYFLQGRLNMSKLSWLDRVILKLGASVEKDPETKKAMLTDFDKVKKENIHALLEAVYSYKKSNASNLLYATDH